MRVATARPGLFELRSEWLTRPIDQEHVDHLAWILGDGGELPPLTVVALESGALAVVDGNHRYAAHLSCASEAIPYRVVGSGEAVIEWWLAAANRSHGLARTREERRAAVRRALSAPEAADMSVLDLARHCGVSADTVRTVREEVRGAPSPAAERRQILEGRRPDEGAVTIPGRTARRARAQSGNESSNDSSNGEAKSDVVDWPRAARISTDVAAAILSVRRRHDLEAIPGGQEIADLLERAWGIADRRMPRECPAPHGAAQCPVCRGEGYTIGDPGDWRAILAAVRS